jgi:hypothetical protein
MTRFFHAIIEHLESGALPSDRALAQRILFQIEDFYIADSQLWHLARIRGKNLQKIMPRYQQLCTTIAVISLRLGFCGYFGYCATRFPGFLEN